MRDYAAVLHPKQWEAIKKAQAEALPALAVAVIAQGYFAGENPPNPYHCGGKVFWWSVNEHRQVEITDKDPLVGLVEEYASDPR